MVLVGIIISIILILMLVFVRLPVKWLAVPLQLGGDINTCISSIIILAIVVALIIPGKTFMGWPKKVLIPLYILALIGFWLYLHFGTTVLPPGVTPPDGTIIIQP